MPAMCVPAMCVAIAALRIENKGEKMHLIFCLRQLAYKFGGNVASILNNLAC